MFFYLELDKEVELHPQYFGPRMRRVLEEKLKQTVLVAAQRSAGQHGAPLCVLFRHSATIHV